MPFHNLMVIATAAVLSLMCYSKAERSQYTRQFDFALDLVEREYVEPVETRKLFEAALSGMVSRLDPHSAFIPPTEFTQFKEGIDQKFGGIGIMVEPKADTRHILVTSPLAGTPAYEAGVQAGDVILKIDGAEVDELPYEDAVERMRGDPGTLVRLTLVHEGDEKPVEIDIERRVIQVESVMGDFRKSDGGWNFFLERQPDVGYVRVVQFGERTAKELAAALESLGDKRGVILDLRYNPGGLLDAARDVCDMFLDEGDIVTIRGRSGETDNAFTAHAGMVLPATVPVVILSNKYSASASEIVAACLQDHARATVVGVRSWGKGSVQNVFDLEGGRSALKITTASYWRPSGRNIHRVSSAKETDEWGVRPNEGFEVKMTEEEELKMLKHRRERDIIGRAASETDPATKPAEPFVDPQLDRALKFLLEGQGDKVTR